MIRGPAALLAALLAAAPLHAHPEYLWQHEPGVTASSPDRLELLGRRAFEARERLAPEARDGWHTVFLTAALAASGQCRRAERLILERPPNPHGNFSTLHAAASFADRDCVDRLITRDVRAIRRGDSGRVDASALYNAGALWRRIGFEEKGQAAIAEAERLYAEREAQNPDDVWACHGGNCISPAWSARIHALRIYHGSPLFLPELNRLSELALDHWRTMNDPTRDSELQISQRVFHALVDHAVGEQEDALALRLMRPLYRSPAYLEAELMARLIAQGETAQALELWPRVGRAFDGFNDFEIVREHPETFHALRIFIREWTTWRNPPELLSRLPVVWIERGDTTRAREALASARADVDSGGPDWWPETLGRLRAVEALLDDSDNPVGRLGSMRFPEAENVLFPDDGSVRDQAYKELASILASAGRWPEADRALAGITHLQVRADALVGQPCGAAVGTEATLATAIERASIHFPPSARASDSESSPQSAIWLTYRCLLRRGKTDAAIAYAQAMLDPVRSLNFLDEIPNELFVRNREQVRRRLAEAALAVAERHDLWNEPAIARVAGVYERMGDERQAERILSRVRDPGAKLLVLIRLLEGHTRTDQ